MTIRRTPRGLRPSHPTVWSVAVGVVVVLAASCASTDEADDGVPTVRLVTYSSFVADQEMLSGVEERLGARIEIISRGDAGAALSEAILTAGRPEGDVFFGVDNALMGRALAGDLFDELGDVALDMVDPALRLDDSGTLAPIQFGDVCVNYDRSALLAAGVAPPESFEDLTDPAYRGMLVVENPATSSPGLVFLAATHEQFGDAAAVFWEDLAANDVAVAGSWDDAWGLRYTVNGGDRPLVVSYASSPPAEVYYSDGTLDEPVSGVADRTCARQVEFAGVLNGADDPDLARRLIEEMLAIPWQESLPLTNFVLPARVGVELPEEFSAHYSAPPASVTLDPATVGEGRDAWIDEWRTLIE